MTAYTLDIQNTPAPRFTVLYDGQPILSGPTNPDRFSQERDEAARLCAFANVALALANAVTRTGEIENSANPLPFLGR